MRSVLRWLAVWIGMALSTGSMAEECPANWKTLHPEWLWCDDFETNKLSSYFDNDSPEMFVRVAGTGLSGSFGRRATWAAGQYNAGSLKLAFGKTAGNPITPPSGVDNTTVFREVYFRIYLKSDANWNGGSSGNNSKMSRALSIVTSGFSFITAMMAHIWSNDTLGNNNFLLMDPARCVSLTTNMVTCTRYNDFTNLVFLGGKKGTTAIFAAPIKGNWNCVETRVKLNDPGQTNGIQEFWIDGNLEASTTNLNFVGSYSTYGINTIFIENFYNNGSPQAQVRYMDNFVVSTQRIGCSPTAVLPAPQNLRITN